MTKLHISALLALGLLAAACTRFATVDGDTVGPGYATSGGEWSSGGGITVAARAFESNGVTVVCGAWTTDQQSALTAHLNDNVVETGSVYLGGSRVVQNLAFMPRVRYAANITGAPAHCVATAKPWRPEFAAAPPEVHFPKLVFQLDRRKGNRVTFRSSKRLQIVH